MTIKKSKDDEVLLERHGDGIATVRVNRPKARNALNVSTRQALAAFFNELGDDEDIRAIVLTGSDEVFVAGADIRDMAGTGAVEMMKRRSERWWGAVAAVPQPVIAAVNGFALGGGMELAMASDMIFCSRDAIFSQPEITWGLITGCSGSIRLKNLVQSAKAGEFLLSGTMINGQDAYETGIANRVYDRGKAVPAAIELAENLAVPSRYNRNAEIKRELLKMVYA